jgi:hypothetical protein
LNILTKISVVVLVLLVLVFCPVLITMATQQPNFKDLHQKDQMRIALLTQDASQHMVLEQRWQTEAAAEKAKADAAVAGRDAEIAKVSRQLDDEKARCAALDARLTSMDLTMKAFQQDAKAMNDRNVKLVADLDKERAEVNNKAKEITRIQDGLNRQTLNAETYQHQADFLRDQLAQDEDKIAKLEEQLRTGHTGTAAGPAGEQPAPGVGPKVTGTVTAIKGDIASINCGSAKGIKVGMIATISRGADYVCSLQIQTVDTNQAAGIVIRKKLDPAAGDKFEIGAEKGGAL